MHCTSSDVRYTPSTQGVSLDIYRAILFNHLYYLLKKKIGYVFINNYYNLTLSISKIVVGTHMT